MKPLTRIPPPGWPKAVRFGNLLYRVSRGRRRWANELGYYGRIRGVYYCPVGRPCYIYLTRTEAEHDIAPEALPKWLRVSEGL